MPILTFELMDVEDANIAINFLDYHQTVADTIDTNISSCKSKVIRYVNTVNDECFIGNGFSPLESIKGNEKPGCVLLTVEILPGRSHEDKTKLGKTLLKLMKATFEIQAQPNIQLRCHIKELSDYYFGV